MNKKINCKLEAGGKLSTWFPPGQLVELAAPENAPRRCEFMKNLFFNVFLMKHIVAFSYFWHFLEIQFFRILNIVVQPYDFWSLESKPFDTEKLTFMCSINFKIFDLFSFFVIFHNFRCGLTVWLFDCSILLEDPAMRM